MERMIEDMCGFEAIGSLSPGNDRLSPNLDKLATGEGGERAVHYTPLKTQGTE